MTNGIITQEVVYKSNKGTPVTDSLKVAQVFGKKHKNILKSIRTMISRMETICFYESIYSDEQGKTQPMFIMNEMGFSLIIKNGLSNEQMQLRDAMIAMFHGKETKVLSSKKEIHIQDVIHIEESGNNRAVSARELHAFLGSNRDFSVWIKNRIDKYGLIENHDYIISHVSGDNSSQPGRPTIEYILSLDAAKELSMVEGNEQGKKARLYFIEVEKRFRQIIQSPPAIPQTLSEALRLAADQAEQIEQQQKQIEAERPRVLFSQAVETAKQSVLIGELAKIICQNGVQIGEKRLFKWLRDNHYLCALGERYNQPTQKAVEQGLFELRKITINVGDNTKVRTTTKVTGKGQIYFVNKFLYMNQNT